MATCEKCGVNEAQEEKTLCVDCEAGDGAKEVSEGETAPKEEEQA